MEESLFINIEHPNITIIPALQKLDNRIPNKFMVILWKPGGNSISIKRNMTPGYMKESDSIGKSQNEQENIGDVAEKIQEKLPPSPKN